MSSYDAKVVKYCTEEVWRQGHDVHQFDGIQRVAWMLDAWSEALAIRKYRLFPAIIDLTALGQMVEPEKNRKGIRKVDVWVGSRTCPNPVMIPQLLDSLWANFGEQQTPLDFYRALLKIHPFVDGNGRTGKIILNWINGTLLDPIFPPNDFWGHVIRNP